MKADPSISIWQGAGNIFAGFVALAVLFGIGKWAWGQITGTGNTKTK